MKRLTISLVGFALVLAIVLGDTAAFQSTQPSPTAEDVSARTYVERGNEQFRLQQYESAVAEYDKAIELDPRQVTAYSNRGNAHFKLEQYERAVADYTEAIDQAI